MAEQDDRELIGQMLLQLRDGLQPVVARVLAPLTPPGRSWTLLLEERDRVAGRTGRYDPNDLQSMLVAMTGRLGSAGYPFDTVLSGRAVSALPQELRVVRNDWAHMKPFSPDDTDRALDSGSRLLRAVGAPEAQTVEAMLTEHRRRRYAGSVAEESIAIAEPAPAAPAVRASAAAPATPSPSETALPAVSLTVPPTYGRDEQPTMWDEGLAAPAQPAAPAAAEPLPVPPLRDRPTSASTATVRIAAETLTTLSYAMAHNAISPISSIELIGTEDVRGAVLEVALSQDSGPIGAPQQYFVDLVHDQPTLVPVRRFVLDGAAMLALDSPRPGRFTMTVRSGERLLGSTTSDVDLLAAQQWRRKPEQLGLEMLPAHVTPHHPLLRGLLVEAADLLRERTGSASLDAYQGEDARTDEIVHAICLAVQRRDVRYANPPASWGDGQIIHTVDEVLDGGLGTCLDTTVVLAAALEQAGVNPLLFVYDGHANLGYWRQEGLRLADELATDPNGIVTLVDLGHIALVETTALTDSAPLDFAAQQQRTVAEHLRGSSGDTFLGAVDVVEARRIPVLPLPVRTRSEEGATVVIEYAPAAVVLPVREHLEGRATPTWCARSWSASPAGRAPCSTSAFGTAC